MSDEAQQVEETYEQHILRRIANALDRIAAAADERNAAIRQDIASRSRWHDEQKQHDAFVRRALEGGGSGGSGGNL